MGGRKRQRSPRPECRPAVLRLGEAEPESLEREPAALTDDEVIKQRDIEHLPGRDDLGGEGHIGRRGGRIARGVVVDGDDGRGLLAHCVTEDLTLPP